MHLSLIAFLLSGVATSTQAFPLTTTRRPSGETDTCLRCHGNQSPAPADPSDGARGPLLPERFSMRWRMYTFKSENAPPFDAIPVPHSISRGETHYDWSSKRMTEIYRDHCIDIFPDGNEFSCKFISDHERTYFITYKLGDLKRPRSCCRWSAGEFWAPRPDVLARMRFQKDSVRGERKVRWWVYDVPLPGPFGYGTTKDAADPVAFWFPAINGWVQQEFFDVSRRKPNPTVFALPDLCRGAIEICKQAR